MSTKKLRRNAPCPCGSGKKYKHCCLRKDRQRHKARVASPSQRQLDQVSHMAQEAMRHVPPDEAQEIQQKLDMAAAYHAMRGGIEAASRALEAHRAEFEALMKDEIAAMDHAQRLFSEERFLPMRYTADDVHRAFEAAGYPAQYREELDEEEIGTLVAAILHLADDKVQRSHLAMQLMMMLPEYVAAGRYLDAWLIQFSAFQMVEAPDKSNPFLFVVFNLAFAEWADQISDHQETLLHELGIDVSEITEMDIEKAEALIKAQIAADPEKEALLEAYYADHPIMSDHAEAELMELERNTLRLLKRDDADCLYLSPEEVDAWVPVIMERLKPLEAQARQAAERGEWSDPDIIQAMGDVLVEVAREMAPAVFTPERLAQLLADLKDYRRALLDAGEKEAATYAHAALIMLEHKDIPTDENRLLIGICFASLRLTMITISREAQAKAENGTETEEVES